MILSSNMHCNIKAKLFGREVYIIKIIMYESRSYESIFLLNIRLLEYKALFLLSLAAAAAES